MRRVSIAKQKGVPPSVHWFRTVGEFVENVQMKGAKDLVSPGYVASKFGIKRQSVHAAIKAGRVEAWYIEGGYVFLSESSCDRYWNRAKVRVTK